MQLHAHPGGGCWVEADSGAYSVPLPAEGHRALVALGWPPLDDDHAPTTNYGFDVEAPVDAYRLVLLLVQTLGEVCGAASSGLGFLVSDCHCDASS